MTRPLTEAAHVRPCPGGRVGNVTGSFRRRRGSPPPHAHHSTSVGHPQTERRKPHGRRLEKGANEMQDRVPVPEEVLRDSRTGGDLPRLLFYDRGRRKPRWSRDGQRRAAGRSWRQASRSCLQASEPGPRTRNQFTEPRPGRDLPSATDDGREQKPAC